MCLKFEQRRPCRPIRPGEQLGELGVRARQVRMPASDSPLFCLPELGMQWVAGVARLFYGIGVSKLAYPLSTR